MCWATAPAQFPTLACPNSFCQDPGVAPVSATFPKLVAKLGRSPGSAGTGSVKGWQWGLPFHPRGAALHSTTKSTSRWVSTYAVLAWSRCATRQASCSSCILHSLEWDGPTDRQLVHLSAAGCHLAQAREPPLRFSDLFWRPAAPRGGQWSLSSGYKCDWERCMQCQLESKEAFLHRAAHDHHTLPGTGRRGSGFFGSQLAEHGAEEMSEGGGGCGGGEGPQL